MMMMMMNGMLPRAGDALQVAARVRVPALRLSLRPVRQRVALLARAAPDGGMRGRPDAAAQVRVAGTDRHR